MRLDYAGEPITPREVEFTLHGSFVDLFEQLERSLPIPERTLTVTLQPGQSWAKSIPRQYRRGQPVEFFINDERFVGRVKFRRLNKLVCVGQFDAVHEAVRRAR